MCAKNSIWGDNIQVALFGESHGPEIGCVIDGLPSGIELNMTRLRRQMARRSAIDNRFATPRKEADAFEIVSGFFNKKTTGTPLCAVIKNTSTRSHDYDPYRVRPGHADYAAYKRYGGFQDYRGGGHFSGRLTAPLVFAGAVCREVLQTLCPDMTFGSRILSIEGVQDREITDWHAYSTLEFSDPRFPMLTKEITETAQEAVRQAMREDDSVGGVIEAWILGVPAGIGDPIFGAVESRLASLLFSIPAIKGVEFGAGFRITALRGSSANDVFRIEDGAVYTESNNNGGINGGITNGMPVVFRCAVKPTSSIAKEQRTINMQTMQNDTLAVDGRHDPCIASRAYVVIEAAAAICMLDLLLGASISFGEQQ